ncbi:unnamed protein product [Tuber melanosporum]|uniref:DNA polymerase kappa n=1 Tax=Tuber melanosporum (strain Mel28) TaxID=656061 RepID=D5G7Y3_TUBMM|nr:uncharacterized protein GSTUM_00002631001 [Tuber melanosporum]CAZ80626.1 unnamed protein product [Tuber melanosporum]
MASEDSKLTPEIEGGDRASLRHSLLGPSLLKAGQDKVDQKKVGEIIYNASKGSKFFKHEERRDQQLTKRIEIIQRRKKHLESLDLSSQIRRVDEEIAASEASRDLSQIIVHVDCDAFYASVEELDRPELKEVPMAVGGGVLTTCNYKARGFGVRSGMAGYIAKQLCPQLVFLPLSFHKYTAKAEEIREILVKYDGRYEAASVDEAFLNITGYLEDHRDTTPDKVVEQLRREVLEHTKISVSAGIAPNARLAKVASNQNKPNGQFRIPNDREAVMHFMRTLPVRRVNGVGRVFERELDAVGVRTWGDVFALRGILSKLFSKKAWSFLLNSYLGLGRTCIHPVAEYERKSLGTESTFKDLSGPGPLRDKLRSTAQELERDLLAANLAGRTITVKVKLHTYQVHSRQKALHRVISSAEDLYNHALPLLQELEGEFQPFKIRLMGLRVTQLSSTRKGTGKMNFFKNLPQSIEGEAEWEAWPEGSLDGLLSSGHLSQEVQDEEQLAIEEALNASLNMPARDTPQDPSPPPKMVLKERWECPICARSLPADDAVFNEHVDFCLSRETIREVVQESAGVRLVKEPERKKDAKARPGRPGSKHGGMDSYFPKLQ